MKNYPVPVIVALAFTACIFSASVASPPQQADATSGSGDASTVSHLGPHLRASDLSQIFAHLAALPPTQLIGPLADDNESTLKGLEPAREGRLTRRLLALRLRHPVIKVAVASYEDEVGGLIKLRAMPQRKRSFSLRALQNDAVSALHTAFNTLPQLDTLDLWAVVPANGSHNYEHLPVFSVSADRGQFRRSRTRPQRAPQALGAYGLVRVAPTLLALTPSDTGGDPPLPETAFDRPPLLKNWERQVKAGERSIRKGTDKPVSVLRDGQCADPQVALTIDDGPHPLTTPLMLAVLDNYNVHATFFLVGEKAEEYPELVRRIAADGHEIGNHSYRHARSHTLTAAEMSAEVKACSSIIKQLTGTPTRYFRPPGGQMNKSGLRALACTDHTLVMWTNNANDWQKPAPEVIAESVTGSARPGDTILMHQGSLESLHALPKILEGLHGRGYEVGTVSELLECEGVQTVKTAPDAAMSYLTAQGFEHE